MIKCNAGAETAAVAVAHRIIIADHTLRRGTHYNDLGAGYFDERDQWSWSDDQ